MRGSKPAGFSGLPRCGVTRTPVRGDLGDPIFRLHAHSLGIRPTGTTAHPRTRPPTDDLERSTEPM